MSREHGGLAYIYRSYNHPGALPQHLPMSSLRHACPFSSGISRLRRPYAIRSWLRGPPLSNLFNNTGRYSTPVKVFHATPTKVPSTAGIDSLIIPNPSENRKPSWRLWTAQEMEFLGKACAEGVPYEDIAHRLGRTVTACQHRARKFNLCPPRPKPKPRDTKPKKRRPWTPQDLAFLAKAYAQRLPTKYIARKLSRTVTATRQAAVKQGLANRRPWSTEDEEVLEKSCAAGESFQEAAQKLGRTIWAIYAQASLRGLTFKSERRRWSTQEQLLLERSLAQGLSYTKIAQMLNRTVAACRVRHAALHDLSKVTSL